MNLQIIILAAGQGTRMHSSLPKVLHPIGGKPMLLRVIETAQQLKPTAIHVIYGHQGERLQHALHQVPVNWVHQAEQLGTGHALLQALPYLTPDAQVLVLSGDVPLINLKTLQTLIKTSSCNASFALLVAHMPDPTGLGRIIRNEQDEISTIVEEKDANVQEKNIKEIYAGICSIKANYLADLLPLINNKNQQKEYLLTDLIKLAVSHNIKVNSATVDDLMEIQGVNTRLQLHQLERIWQQRIAERLLEQGVTIADAARFDVRGELHCGRDVFIDVNCVFEGEVRLGDNCSIGPNCILSNVTLGVGCTILANSVLEGSVVDEHCHIGPFARLRTGTQLAAGCKIGNFVETKKAIFGEHSKASHLSYLGDVQIGKEVNIGAGTITCNYDGVNKHQTVIEDGAFIGSDTQLVAPVTVGAYATVGAGSTIRKNVPAQELTLTESTQKTFYGWKRPVKRTDA